MTNSNVHYLKFIFDIEITISPLQIGHRMSNAGFTLGSSWRATVHRRSRLRPAFHLLIARDRWRISRCASTMDLPKSWSWLAFAASSTSWIHGINQMNFEKTLSNHYVWYISPPCSNQLETFNFGIHWFAKEWDDEILNMPAVTAMLESFRWIRCSFTYFQNPGHHFLHSLRAFIC